MSEREDLEQAIATVEAQRATLGDAAVDAVLEGLRQKLVELAAAETQSLPQTAARTSGGERRIVTVLFCDVTGSTALAEKMDPELWAEIMDQAFEYLIEPVDRYGGTVARLMGDAILAFFGAPTTHEDDPQRAVEASLDILENIQPYRDALQRERGLDFNVRVGINTGLVVTGRIGSKIHEEYTALGDAANIAARMEQTAVPGTIQISEKTYRLVASQFECVPLGGITVKGKSKPVQTYRVMARATQPERAQSAKREQINSNMVGREPEFAAIQSSVGRLLEGQGGIFCVVSEAGVGKSRLAAEVRQSSPQESLIWLEGRTLSYGQTISYWPFQEILWAYAGINEEDGEAAAWQKLENQLMQLFGEETVDVLPFLAALISLEVQGDYKERVKHLDSEAIGHQIYMAARRFFERLATIRPTVIVVEDLQWADESSVSLLEHLLPLAERLPILFLITGRPYRQSPLAEFCMMAKEGYPAHYSEITLSPLSQEACILLTRNLLNIDQLPHEIQTLIVSKAGGNPFYLEEIVRALIDTGAVVYNPAGSRWQATAELHSIAIPDTVQGIIMARVDRLDQDAKRVLQAAAVIGRSFFYRVLEAVGYVESALDQHLLELEQVGFLRKKQTVPELEYIFNNALAQEATYESILFRKRRSLHARVGQVVERLFADRLEEFYGVLAYHYAQAEDWEKAQEYLFKAGDKAGQVAADAEALAHYQEALAAYERAFGDSWDPVQRAILARKMGEAYFRRGEHEQALEQFQIAFKLLGRPGIPPPRVPAMFAVVRELFSQLGHRLMPYLLVKPGSEQVSLAVEEEARIHNLLGWIFLFSERERFLWASLRRLNFAEQSGYRPGAATGSSSVAVVCDMVPLIDLAESYHLRAAALAGQSGDLNALGIAYQGLSFHELNLGNLKKSTAHARRSEEGFRKAGDLHGLGNALNLIGFNHIHQGFLRMSLAYVEELISTGQDGADPQLVCWGSIGRGVARERLGLLDEALADFEQGLKLADMLPDYYWKILGQAFYGRCLLWQGKLAEAFAALAEGRRVHKKRGIGGPALYHLRIVQTEGYLMAAEQSQGEKRASHLKSAGQACKASLKLAKTYKLFLAESYRFNGTLQWLKGNRQEAGRLWQRSLSEGEKLDLHYECGLTHVEMARRLQDQSHLQLAEELLTEAGAEWHLVEV